MAQQNLQLHRHGRVLVPGQHVCPRTSRHHLGRVPLAVARAPRKTHWHLQIGTGVHAPMPISCGVTNPIAITRLEHFDDTAMQKMHIRHISVCTVCSVLRVPRPENMLLPVAKPQPKQLAAIKAGNNRRKVSRQPALALLQCINGEPIRERHGATVGVPGRKLHSNLRTRVSPIHSHLLNAQGVQCVGQCIGQIFCGDRLDRQQIRQTKPRGIGGDHGELLCEIQHVIAHHFGRASRCVQQNQHRPCPTTQIMDAPVFHRHKVFLDVGFRHGLVPRFKPRTPGFNAPWGSRAVLMWRTRLWVPGVKPDR